METGGSNTTSYTSARPIKHWRKQLNPRNGSGANGRRAGINMSMDIPGGSNILANTGKCDGTTECAKTSTILSDNILGINNNNFSDGITTINPITNQVQCVACNPEAKVIKPATTIISKKYYPDRNAYLQSRCLLYDQKLSGNKIPGITYFDTVNDRPVLPSNDLINGSQNRSTENCLNCPNNVKNNTNTTIYKPRNYQYATQGAVDSSSRITRLKYNTITKNGKSFQTAFGIQGANAGAFYNGSDVSPYFLKNKNNNKCYLANFHRTGEKTICV
jgi:hypothetical protein